MRFALLALALFGCNGSGDTDDDDSDDGDEAITLDNCGGTVASGAPAFYSRYFACVDVAVDGQDVAITTTDLPPHPSYYYGIGHPNYEAWDSRGGAYNANPSSILVQDVTVEVPLSPVSRGLTITDAMVDLTAGTSQYEYPGGMGVALDGVVLFAGFAAPGDDIRDEEYSFDSWSGHAQNTGQYHHHTAAPGPLTVLEHKGLIDTPTPGSGEIELYGIMCDGTVILGCTELDGSDPQGSLDAQSGHVHDLVDEEGTTHFAGRYHTHLCEGNPNEFTPEIQYYEGCDGFGPPN